jgi:Uma2 family endonuclease
MMVETLPRVQVLSDPGPEVPPVEADGPGPCKRLLTREEYHKMAEAGIFGPDERLELIDGEVYKTMSPQARLHARAIMRLASRLREAFGEGFYVQQQLPLAGPDSEPEPDLSVLPGTPEDAREHPLCADAALVVEVADTSLRTDRKLKAPFYARAGVRDFWIVNLKHRTVEVYREPGDAGAPSPEYKSVRIYTEGETLSPLAAPEAALAVSDILPPE